ncbi:hypothetical protein ACHAW5_002790 [Stephanodiscus triporus]|uniref:Uncharacterized protein n=1 Tax=Stephanodiscus triporus TaxID=2934178 RepID=A0ABD3NL27_9STRA
MAPFKKTSTAEKGAQSSSTTSSAAIDFDARRSARAQVVAGRYIADDDTWIEALAVCETGTGAGNSAGGGTTKKSGGGLFRKFKSKGSTSDSNDDHADDADVDADVAAASQRLTIRPYFQSQKTGKREWDEPPSGASNIVYATPEARRMAHAQLEEMRSSFALAALARRQDRAEKEQEQSSGGGGSRLSTMIPRAFKRTSAENADENQLSSSLLGNSHASRRSRGLSDRGVIPKSILDESKEMASAIDTNSYEADLQRAMLMSLEIGGGSVMGAGDSKHRCSSKSVQSSPTATSGLTRAEEEQLAMAVALSLSEQEERQSKNTRKSSQADCDRDFDGGGKMPAVRHARIG